MTTPVVHLASLGCARNQVDSEGMAGRLQAAGCTISDDPEAAEIIIVNTCSFIEAAAAESIDTILALARCKESGRCRSLIVTGCLPERYGAEIAAELPEVDRFLGTGAFDAIEAAIRESLFVPRCHLPDPMQAILPDPDAPRRLTTPHSAYLKIAEGCSRHCTYCIIPKLRGTQKSRPAAHILREAQGLIRQGVRELVLVAQDTTAYGSDLPEPVRLDRLLGELADLSPEIWIRVLYGHPESIDPPIIRTMAERPNICSYYDLPIQHASPAVLNQMGRRHPPDDTKRLFDRIREIDPEASLRTTVITGFPGETERDFELLRDFIASVRFDHLGVFTYSDAEDLPSHRLREHVPQAVAEERRNRLMGLQARISTENLERRLEQTLPVLIDEADQPGVYLGRTAFQAPEVDGIVFVNGTALSVGRFVSVTVTDTLEYDLVGDAVPLSPHTAGKDHP